MFKTDRTPWGGGFLKKKIARNVVLKHAPILKFLKSEKKIVPGGGPSKKKVAQNVLKHASF